MIFADSIGQNRCRIIKTVWLILIAIAASIASDQQRDSIAVNENKHYRDYLEREEKDPTDTAAIIFLGNSITYGGQWKELLQRTSVRNHGVQGDNTRGILNRLKYVISKKPVLCFIMAGINDIYDGVPVEKVFANYQQIIDSLKRNNITPVITSTLYVNPRWKYAERNNPGVRNLNALLETFAQENKIIFINLNAVLAKNEILMDEYTTDGLHLTTSAYLQWSRLLLPILDIYGL